MKAQTRDPASLVLLSILVLVVVAAVIAFLTNLLLAWAQALDQVLDATLFATLAGLSIAGAAILLAASELVAGLIPAAQQACNTARSRAQSLSDFSSSDQWFTDQHLPSIADIDARKPSHDVAEYLRRRRDLVRLEDAAKAMHEGNLSLVNSFMLFVVGLVEALTIDLLVTSTESAVSSLFGIIDLAVASTLLLAGLVYLVAGGRRIHRVVSTYLH